MQKLINQISQTLSELLKQYRVKLQQQNADKQQALTQQRIYNFMCCMRNDLYEALKGHSYANVRSIATPQDIRISNYKQVEHGFLYQFTLAKTNITTHTASILLDQIKINMNQDIISAQQLLCDYGTCQYIISVFPFLYYGVYVLGVQDHGGSDVIITVTTNVAL